MYFIAMNSMFKGSKIKLENFCNSFGSVCWSPFSGCFTWDWTLKHFMHHNGPLPRVSMQRLRPWSSLCLVMSSLVSSFFTSHWSLRLDLTPLSIPKPNTQHPHISYSHEVSDCFHWSQLNVLPAHTGALFQSHHDTIPLLLGILIWTQNDYQCNISLHE